MKNCFLIIFCLSIHLVWGQKPNEIGEVQALIGQHHKNIDSLSAILEDLQLKEINQELSTNFLPKIDSLEQLITHKAMFLVYDEEHEQAKWVLHKISTNILEGTVSRTNDFRTDPLVESGSAEEIDYFIKTKRDNGKYDYDGYGYDRGHLAPSADFRWSKKALSESYYYSNMSPQLPSFNREKWADLEGLIRGYIYENKRALIVYTGPVLHPKLQKVSRSTNKVSIPEQFFKVVVDFEAQKAIAYLMPQEHDNYPVEYFATTIDEIENLTGIDFLYQIDDKTEATLESQKEVAFWLPEKQKSDVVPFEAEGLGKGKFNTIQARMHMDTGQKKEVCGTVVSAYFSKNKHTFLNLDKSFPNQVFSVTIWNSNLHNFAYQPHIELKDKKVCVRGKISENKGIPTMDVVNDKAIVILE
jgi:endonuclease G